ncbi:phage Gp37/Gp68 family protein [Streptomyces sp. NPDC088337]|uniref:phage Gp37/Gp68 family protein n=1 Tax=unclassified Streptomyces TaxID=2593676 RepID=UPI0038278F1F
MATNTSIEWADKTWSPLIGCERVSPGCDSCYAINTARIREGNPHPKIAAAFAGTTQRTAAGIDWSGRVNLLTDRLTEPLHWKKARKVFVNSLSDLFHDQVPDDFIARVWAVMAATTHHTYQVLTKRHARMRALLRSDDFRRLVKDQYAALKLDGLIPKAPLVINVWPLRNVHLGVSVEDQQWANIRVPVLLDTPAAVRFLSCEPLLGPVDLSRLRPHVCGRGPGGVCERWIHGIDWVIVGGESGPRARPMHPDWARSLRDQSVAAGVPFFFKQHGEWVPLGPLYGDLEETDDGHLEAVALEVVEGKRVIQLESDGYIAEGHQPSDSRTWLMARVGKRAAGRVLDGRTHDAYPRDDFRESIASGLTESFEDFSRRLDAADTTRRTR